MKRLLELFVFSVLATLFMSACAGEDEVRDDNVFANNIRETSWAMNLSSKDSATDVVYANIAPADTVLKIGDNSWSADALISQLNQWGVQYYSALKSLRFEESGYVTASVEINGRTWTLTEGCLAYTSTGNTLRFTPNFQKMVDDGLISAKTMQAIKLLYSNGLTFEAKLSEGGKVLNLQCGRTTLLALTSLAAKTLSSEDVLHAVQSAAAFLQSLTTCEIGFRLHLQ